jgi:hypothetical protein
MRLLYLHPTRDERSGNTCVATVDVEFSDDIRLYGLRLMRMRDGKHMVFAPQSGQRRTATFSKQMAEQLTTLAVDAWERDYAA